MSKRRSTSTRRKRRKKRREKQFDPVFLLDRTMGRYEFLSRVIESFPTAKTHDSVFHDKVRDPEMLYCCGKLKWVVVSGDQGQLTGKPHLAAIELGATAVFTFTNNHSGAETWAKAFNRARNAILRMVRKRPRPFLAKIGLDGQVRAVDLAGVRKRIGDLRDEASFLKAKSYEQGQHGKGFTIPASLRRG